MPENLFAFCLFQKYVSLNNKAMDTLRRKENVADQAAIDALPAEERTEKKTSDSGENLKKKAEEAAHVAKEHMTEATNTVKEKATEAAHTAQETVQKAKHRLKEKLD